MSRRRRYRLVGLMISFAMLGALFALGAIVGRSPRSVLVAIMAVGIIALVIGAIRIRKSLFGGW